MELTDLVRGGDLWDYLGGNSAPTVITNISVNTAWQVVANLNGKGVLAVLPYLSTSANLMYRLTRDGKVIEGNAEHVLRLFSTASLTTAYNTSGHQVCVPFNQSLKVEMRMTTGSAHFGNTIGEFAYWIS